MFYQLGALQTWEMTCELFEYSDELLSTGIPEIDSLQKNFSTNILDWTIDDEYGIPIITEDGDYLTQEGSSLNDLIAGSDNLSIQNESDLFIDFTSVDPFSESTI